jgi:hypothetical protein
MSFSYNSAVHTFLCVRLVNVMIYDISQQRYDSQHLLHCHRNPFDIVIQHDPLPPPEHTLILPNRPQPLPHRLLRRRSWRLYAHDDGEQHQRDRVRETKARDPDENVYLRLGARGTDEGCAGDELRTAGRRTWRARVHAK